MTDFAVSREIPGFATRICFIAKMNLPVLAKYFAALIPCRFIESIALVLPFERPAD